MLFSFHFFQASFFKSFGPQLPTSIVSPVTASPADGYILTNQELFNDSDVYGFEAYFASPGEFELHVKETLFKFSIHFLNSGKLFEPIFCNYYSFGN